jgi:hypothetical protein
MQHSDPLFLDRRPHYCSWLFWVAVCRRYCISITFPNIFTNSKPDGSGCLLYPGHDQNHGDYIFSTPVAIHQMVFENKKNVPVIKQAHYLVELEKLEKTEL